MPGGAADECERASGAVVLEGEVADARVVVGAPATGEGVAVVSGDDPGRRLPVLPVDVLAGVAVLVQTRGPGVIGAGGEDHLVARRGDVEGVLPGAVRGLAEAIGVARVASG